MQVGITVQKLQHPDYAEEGHYLNVRWQKFADAIGVTLIPIATTKLAKQMIDKRDKEIRDADVLFDNPIFRKASCRGLVK